MKRAKKGTVPAAGGVVSKITADWTLYQTADGKHKLVADVPVLGKANYSLKLDGKIITFQLDKGKLRQDRPELLLALEAYLAGENSDTIPNAADDPYGDAAVLRGAKLTESQTWLRRLMYMREHYLTQTAMGMPTALDVMLKAHYRGLYKTEPSEEVIRTAKDFITRGKVPHIKAILPVLREYYDGKYKPKSLETLALNLDIITGVF